MYDPRMRTRALKLLSQGFSVGEVSRQTGISTSTLGNWKRDPDRAAAYTPATCPRCHDRDLDRPAYAYLLGLYLGDGHIANTHREGVKRLEIACCDTWPGLKDEAERAIKRVMPELKVGRRTSVGCTNIGAYSKHWPCLFPQHGPGLKHTRKIELAAWQQEIVKEHGRELVCGLIHSDGCRVTNRVRRLVQGVYKEYEYPRYMFSNASDDIRALFTDALDRLGIAWKRSNTRIISIAKKEAVARLDEFVGPKY